MIPPVGGTLIERTVPAEEFAERLAAAEDRSLPLSREDMIHVVNLVTGVYSPLTGFMTEPEYLGVVQHDALPGGADWTIPIVLRIAPSAARDVAPGRPVALCGPSGQAIAVLDVESVFHIDLDHHCEVVFGTRSDDHPGVQEVHGKPDLCVGGRIHGDADRLPVQRHFHTPAQSRQLLAETGFQSFVAFSTRNICHLGHEYLHNLALERADLLGIHVITGAQVKGNFVPDVIFDTYEFLIANIYPPERVVLNNLRLPPIYAGPREAFLQATMLQNLGYSHFVVGRDHAGVGSFYPKYGSQEIFQRLTGLDIRILAFSEPRFCKACGKITTERSCRHGGQDVRPLNGRDVRRLILEKRYYELDSIVRKELQLFVTHMFEEKLNPRSDELEFAPPRQVFFE